MARDSGLVPVGFAIYRTNSSKPIPEIYKNNKPARKVVEKESDETIQETDSGKTLTNPELLTRMTSNINQEVILSEAKNQDKETLQQAI